MIIGNFTCNEAQDTYTGELSTFSVGARKVVFRPVEAKTDRSPSHRIFSPSKAGDVELGAAWQKRSEESREYLSVRLDDPALPLPVNCAMVESGDTPGAFILVWSRDSRKAKAE